METEVEWYEGTVTEGSQPGTKKRHWSGHLFRDPECIS